MQPLSYVVTHSRARDAQAPVPASPFRTGFGRRIAHDHVLPPLNVIIGAFSLAHEAQLDWFRNESEDSHKAGPSCALFHSYDSQPIAWKRTN